MVIYSIHKSRRDYVLLCRPVVLVKMRPWLSVLKFRCLRLHVAIGFSSE